VTNGAAVDTVIFYKAEKHSDGDCYSAIIWVRRMVQILRFAKPARRTFESRHWVDTISHPISGKNLIVLVYKCRWLVSLSSALCVPRMYGVGCSIISQRIIPTATVAKQSFTSAFRATLTKSTLWNTGSIDPSPSTSRRNQQKAKRLQQLQRLCSASLLLT
jgi:hypothetical protein